MSSAEIIELIPPTFSDEALALRFAERHHDDLRYVAAWSRWLIWNGEHWQFDDTLKAFDLARWICRTSAAECNKAKIANNIASAKTVAAVERLAKADRRLAATIEQWDADPWLLNTPEGAVDLRTGACRLHVAGDYMTKITTVSPDRNCDIQNWLAFLDRISGGDAELVNFLQRVAGYSLTGVTREHAMFFLYGTGANGKTTFLNAITGALGDYCRNAPIETFTATQSERHPTDLAGLRGARLVTAVETEEGRRWAESKIKALTGGDKISARFMRQDFFEYVPQFKLLIAGNHKPGLRSVDEAIRRRLHLIPFTVTIPPEERDPELPNKLKAESAGILQWAVQGCLDWQERGLAPPTIVTAATAAYLEAEDAIAAWISDCCEIDPNHWEKRTTLFINWSAWATKTGEFVGSQKRFIERIENRPGITPKRQRTGDRGFKRRYNSMAMTIPKWQKPAKLTGEAKRGLTLARKLAKAHGYVIASPLVQKDDWSQGFQVEGSLHRIKGFGAYRKIYKDAAPLNEVIAFLEAMDADHWCRDNRNRPYRPPIRPQRNISYGENAALDWLAAASLREKT
jgi:putative DNA primase/helicase